MKAGEASLHRRHRGFATVEMALVTPVLLIIMLVSAEFTRAFLEFNTLTKSVRDAARFAAKGALKNDSVDLSRFASDTKNLAVSGHLGGGTALLNGLTTNDITVQVVNLGVPPARPYIQVTGIYTFQPLAPVINGLGFLSDDISMNFTLRAQSTMRAQK